MTELTYRVQVDRIIEAVDGAAWDALCGERPFTTVYWLKFLELVFLDYEPTYLQLWQGEQLVAGAVCLPQQHFHLSAYLKNKVLHNVAARALAWLPPYACVLPLFLRDGLLLHPEVETGVWLPILLAEIEKLSRQRWAPFTYLGNLSAEMGIVGQQHAFVTLPILQDTYLNIVWDNFDDYLRHLTAKRRKRVKTYRQNAQEAGVVMHEATLESSLRPQIEGLMYGVAAKHANVLLYRPDFLQRANDYLLPETVCALVACVDQEPAACITLFHSGGEMVAKWSGMNYALTHKSYAYHYLMIEIVRKAIELGVKRLDLGPTSYVLKRQLGATFEDRVAGLKVGIRPFNTLFRQLMVSKMAADA
ncbi:GNAT family N-acetyltransferase [Candidatus Leptofilum sp.]|uniref:GNAT family N-acetyltransferase n=1 Tax=Candidatus Leptofilum sp. TaxID=3241576 RepID=UPI003B5BA2B4